jgi:hypothetical protein
VSCSAALEEFIKADGFLFLPEIEAAGVVLMHNGKPKIF